IVQPHGRAVARQLGKLEPRLEALFHGAGFVIRDLFQRGALGGIPAHQCLTLLFAFDHRFLGHGVPLRAQALKGMLKCFNSARASASVCAVVAITISIPQVSSTLSKSISGNTMCSLRPMAKLP